MNQHDFIAALAQVQDTTQTAARQALDSVCATLAAALEQGQPVTLPGVGAFKVVDRAARPGRNPKTGETMTIPARKAVTFKPAKALKLA